MDLCPLAPAFGVEIPDVQLSCYSTEFVTNVLRPLLLEHKLLVSRGQRMSCDAHVLRAVEVPRSGGDTVFARSPPVHRSARCLP